MSQGRFRHLLFLLLAVSALLASMGTGAGYFYDIDEPKYASALYEMWETGDLLVPMNNGVPRLEKPPLTYWLGLPFAALAGAVDGAEAITPLTCRMASVAASVLLTAGVVLLGRRLFGDKAGLLAGLMVQASVVFHFLASLYKVDVFFSCCLTWETYFLVRMLQGDRGTTSRAGAILSAGLGALAKGPFAFLPVAGYLAALPLSRWGEGEPAGKAVLRVLRREWLFVMVCGLLGSLPFLAWLASAQWIGGVDFLGGFSGQFQENTTVSSLDLFSRVLLTGFYADTLFFAFFPWAAFLPGAIVWSLRRFRQNPKAFAVFWGFMIVYVLFFTFLFKLKSHRYMLPAMPLAAMLISGWLCTAERDKSYRFWFDLCSMWGVAVAAFFCLRFFKGGYVPVNLYHPLVLDDFRPTVMPMAVVLVVGLAVYFWAWKIQPRRPAAHVLALTACFVAFLPAYYSALPVARSGEGPSPILAVRAYDEVQELAGPGLLVIHSARFGRVHPSFTFFQKGLAGKTGKGEGAFYSLAPDFDPALFASLLLRPAKASGVGGVCRGQVNCPAGEFFARGEFDRTVLLLLEEEYRKVEAHLRKLPSVVLEETFVRKIEGLTVKWTDSSIRLVSGPKMLVGRKDGKKK